MSPEPIVGRSSGTERQSTSNDDISLSLSPASSCSDFDQFLDNLHQLDPVLQEELVHNSSHDDLQIDAKSGCAKGVIEACHGENDLTVGFASRKSAVEDSPPEGNADQTEVPTNRQEMLRMSPLHPSNSICHNQTSIAVTTTQDDKASSALKHDSETNKEVIVTSLQNWNNTQSQNTKGNPTSQRTIHQESIMQKITIGFGICKLLQHANQVMHHSSLSELKPLCSISNFAVEMDGSSAAVRGVHMISPFLSLQITSKKFMSSYNVPSDVGASFGVENIDGRDVEAFFPCPLDTDEESDTSDREGALCSLLGTILHYLFTGTEPVRNTYRLGRQKDDRNYEVEGPLAKKKSMSFVNKEDEISVLHGADFSQAISIMASGASDCRVAGVQQLHLHLPPLTDFGYPSSLSQLVLNLVNSGQDLFRPDDAYPSLDVVMEDMKLLLQRPNLFLFGSPPTKGTVFTSNELYGRSKESAALTNAYYRVAITGKSESIFVGGYSGSGKTSLVYSLIQTVTSAGGFAVTQKFDEMESCSPLTVILSAFNELCIMVAQQSSQSSLDEMYQCLSASIGSNLVFLTRVLPNFIDLIPPYVQLPSTNNDDTGINLNSLSFTLQQLTRVITSSSRPVLMFLDDLQWACPMTLNLLKLLISGLNSTSWVLFVGGFRDNEIVQHQALAGFLDQVNTCAVTTSVITLDGISAEDVNSMISDGLGILPRLCRELSSVVFRKTNGNPFFALELLRSLFDRGLIVYSLRDKHVKWDLAQISSENITDNVLFLLSNKMNVLSKRAKTALKVASCFGSSISIDIARCLNLRTTLDDVVVKEGFMDFNGLHYRFSHDKFRESAYSLINPEERGQYHFDIGIALMKMGPNENEGNNTILFATVNQINRMPSSMIRDDSQRILMINLNYEAGMRSMECSNFTSAHTYFKAAVALLPENSWQKNYEITLDYSLHLAKAAYSCMYVSEARDILDEIIEQGERLDDKSLRMLDSYSLLVSLLCLAHKDLEQAFIMCIKVLILLGEDLPDKGVVSDEETTSVVARARVLFQQKSNEDLLAMNGEASRCHTAIMQFYDQLAVVSIFRKPKQCPYFIARWAIFCITNNVSCKYTAGAFVSFSCVLCSNDMCSKDWYEDARIACRIGKIGMAILGKSDELTTLPGVYTLYYAYTGSLCEPIQAAANMLQHGYDIGMQIGNPSKAALNLSVMYAKQLKVGVNLLILKNNIDHQLKMTVSDHLRCNLLVTREVVLGLIGEDEGSSTDEKDIIGWGEVETSLQIMLSFYFGHFERAYHKAKMWQKQEETILKMVPYRVIYIAFFSGLASASLYTQGKKNCQKHLTNLSKSLAILERARHFSDWNFANRHLLLKAVKCSITGEATNAEREFDAAIHASQASKFVHEEGIALETAAMHYKKNGDKDMALNLFRQAESCYKAWGSEMKVRHVARQIKLLG